MYWSIFFRNSTPKQWAYFPTAKKTSTHGCCLFFLSPARVWGAWGIARCSGHRGPSKERAMFMTAAWRILLGLVSCKWLVTPIYRPFRPFGRGTTQSLGDFLTMIIKHLLTGMILGWSAKWSPDEQMSYPATWAVKKKSPWRIHLTFVYEFTIKINHSSR